MYKSIILFALVFCCIDLSAQIKQGEVVFEVKVLGLDEATSEMLSGTNMVMTFNKKMSKVVLDMIMVSNTTIIDLKAQEGVMLFDAMGRKISTPLTKEQVTDQMVDDYSLVPSNETQEYAGFDCRVYKIESDIGEFSICLSNDIEFESGYNTQFVDLDGFPLQYTMNYNGMTISLTATDVVKRRVKKKEFVIPAGYEEKSFKELGGVLGL